MALLCSKRALEARLPPSRGLSSHIRHATTFIPLLQRVLLLLSLLTSTSPLDAPSPWLAVSIGFQLQHSLRLDQSSCSLMNALTAQAAAAAAADGSSHTTGTSQLQAGRRIAAAAQKRGGGEDEKGPSPASLDDDGGNLPTAAACSEAFPAAEESSRRTAPSFAIHDESLSASDPKRFISAPSFAIHDDQFWLDGSPIRLISGSLHYFRIPSQYWRDRMQRAKSLGLNTIQFYIPWNFHETSRGHFNFHGQADFVRFIQLAAAEGLLVLLRLGPYVCGEWDLGGFPPWLLAERPKLELRTSDPNFLKLSDAWWDVLLPMVRPLLRRNGGPVLMVQIENEYGFFGSDHQYLRHLLLSAKRHLGEKTIIYTTDSGYYSALAAGSLKGAEVYTAVDGGYFWNYSQVFEVQKKFNAPGASPPMTMEFYLGWLTHWGESMPKLDIAAIAASIDSILSMNASISFYMVHGGTSFGFFAGANSGGSEQDYEPDITSYDYRAPIGEGGEVDNELYDAVRRIVSRHVGTLPAAPPLPSRAAFGRLLMSEGGSMLRSAEGRRVVTSERPKTMEELGQAFGFVLYRYTLPAVLPEGSVIKIEKLHDYAKVFLTQPNEKLSLPLPSEQSSLPLISSTSTASRSNFQPISSKLNQASRHSLDRPRRLLQDGPHFSHGFDGQQHVLLGKLARWSPRQLSLPDWAAGQDLTILVEGMGRINFGSNMFDEKGISGDVHLNGHPLRGNWSHISLALQEDDYFDPAGGNLEGQVFKVKEQGNYFVKRETHGAMPRCSLIRSTSFSPLPTQIRALSLFFSPTFFRAFLFISSVADTFLNMRGWSKGYVWINEVNLGRYWPAKGPQCHLFVPSSILRAGENEVVILELDHPHPDFAITFESEKDFTCGKQQQRKRKKWNIFDMKAWKL